MRFGILGPLEVTADDRSVMIGAPMQRAVLVLLLLRANTVVPTAEMIELLWGDHPPRTARVTVQTYVLRLRRAPQAAAGGTETIVTHPPGYIVRAGAEELDLFRFDDLMARAQDARARGALEDAGTLLRSALGLWRGQPLADIGSDRLRQVEAQRLEERRMRAVEDRIDVDLEVGRHLDTVGEL